MNSIKKLLKKYRKELSSGFKKVHANALDEGSSIDSSGDYVRSLLSINDIVGKDISLKFENYNISNFDGGLDFTHDDLRSAFLKKNSGLISYNSIGMIAIKVMFEILDSFKKEGLIEYSIISVNYRTESVKYPTSIGILISDDKGSEFIIDVSGIREIKDSIPDKFNKWKSSNGRIYLTSWPNICYLAKDYVLASKLTNALRKEVLKKGLAEFDKPVVEVITVDKSGLDTKTVEIEGNTLSEESMGLHYGEDFPVFNNALLKKMEESNKGVVLLHGKPGNGKTYYIRHLVSKLKSSGKRVIIVPKHVLAEMESPEFNDFMIDEFSNTNEKAVFVIEDAESVLRARDAGGDGRAVVSTILNLSDGILNDIFKVQLICTFNTELRNIDEALLRPGRLIARKEFDPLDKNSANKLIKDLGFEHEADGKMSLAEIYALGTEEEDEILIQKQPKRNRMGFV